MHKHKKYQHHLTGLHVQKAYTSLGTSSMQILLLSIFGHHPLLNIENIENLDTQCVHLVNALVANCNQNAYMHEQQTKEFGVRIVAGSTLTSVHLLDM